MCFLRKQKNRSYYHKKKAITSIEELKKEIKLPLMFVVFDTETNGLKWKDDVLSLSALKFYYDGETLTQVDSLERYYFPKWFLNKEATSINGLTRKELRKKRKGCKYPRHYYDDFLAFIEFIGNDTSLFIGHNIAFDTMRYRFLSNKKKFCTMYSLKNEVKALNKEGKIKNPKLMEAAKHFNIELNENKLHGSMYDTEITSIIFQIVLERNFSNGGRHGNGF